jgi:hypothetical protein
VTNGCDTSALGVASFQVIGAASVNRRRYPHCRNIGVSGAVLSNVSQTENVVSRVLVRLNRIVEAFDDKAASRWRTPRFGSL